MRCGSAPRRGVAVGLAGAIVLCWLAACAAPAPSAAPGPERGAGACPASFRPPESIDTAADREGELVPSGAVDAVLCVFAFAQQDTSGAYPLVDEVPAKAGDVGHLIDDLNGLDPVHENSMCNLMGHDQYEILLRYGDRGHVLVSVSFNCGVVSSARAYRGVNSFSALLGHWPDR